MSYLYDRPRLTVSFVPSSSFTVLDDLSPHGIKEAICSSIAIRLSLAASSQAFDVASKTANSLRSLMSFMVLPIVFSPIIDHLSGPNGVCDYNKTASSHRPISAYSRIEVEIPKPPDHHVDCWQKTDSMNLLVTVEPHYVHQQEESRDKFKPSIDLICDFKPPCFAKEPRSLLPEPG